jgi:hypothetical protein
MNDDRLCEAGTVSSIIPAPSSRQPDRKEPTMTADVLETSVFE